jgi:hypothetical protein
VGDAYPSLSSSQHAVYRLAPGLLLVFKPSGHHEERHAHAHRQRLRVLRGRLLVRTARRTLLLEPDGAALTLSAGRSHATEALQDTWLVAETVERRTVRAPSARPAR